MNSKSHTIHAYVIGDKTKEVAYCTSSALIYFTPTSVICSSAMILVIARTYNYSCCCLFTNYMVADKEVRQEGVSHDACVVCTVHVAAAEGKS